MKKRVKFSAYWYVKGNTKQTAKHAHIKHAQEKDLDYFICQQDQTGDFKKRIDLDYKDLPSSLYLTNLTDFCKSRDTVFTKFGKKITSESFLKLATIWTSKVLLFQKIVEYTDADYLIWVDCVSAKNLNKITSSDSDKCCINRYGKSVKGKDFGGLLKNTLPTTKILAQVIKIPRLIVPQFIEKYIECLQFTDSNFLIYDEEIILTIMYQRYSYLFNLYN